MTTTTKLGPEVTTETEIIAYGGFGYDEVRHQNLTNHLRRLGYAALEPLPDPDIDAAPTGYRIRTEDGQEKQVARQRVYTQATRPEVTLISSLQQEARADELISHIEAESTGPINGFFQSADAQNGLLAAYRRPDLFKNIILAFPAGLIKKQSPVEYTRRMMRGAREHRGEKHVIPLEVDFEAGIRKTSLRERKDEQRIRKSGGFTVASSVALAYQNQLLHEMRENVEAPGVSLLLGLKDAMMDPGRIIESLESANDIDYILVVNRKHGINGDTELLNMALAMLPKMDESNALRRVGEDPKPLRERVIFSSDVVDEDKESILKLVHELEARSASTANRAPLETA